MTHPHRDRTALVLAGGGLTGAVYEIGALRAIDDLLVDRTVNDFDIYVGTSAGSLVATVLANGISPETMMQAIAGDHPDIPPIGRDALFHLDYHDLWRLGWRIPDKVAGALSHYLRHLSDMTPFDLVWSLTEALPPGLYDNLALEKYLREVVKTHGYSNHFNRLKRDLYIIATDLDTGKREVFGRDHNALVPVSMAVAASTALPIFYKPVRINGHDYVDGGVRGNASLDLAIEHGANLVVCINPLVPFDNTDRASIPFLGPDGGYLSEKGLSAIASQVGRIQTHAGLHYHIKQLRHKHPKVDIILIEPSMADYQMFFYNIMRYSARMIVARHGFETVTLKLAEDYEHMKELLARHNLRINQRLVLEELTAIREADYAPAEIRRVLAMRSASYRRHRHGRHTGQVKDLRHTLVELDGMLKQLGGAAPDSAAHNGVASNAA